MSISFFVHKIMLFVCLFLSCCTVNGASTSLSSSSSSQLTTKPVLQSEVRDLLTDLGSLDLRLIKTILAEDPQYKLTDSMIMVTPDQFAIKAFLALLKATYETESSDLVDIFTRVPEYERKTLIALKEMGIRTIFDYLIISDQLHLTKLSQIAASLFSSIVKSEGIVFLHETLTLNHMPRLEQTHIKKAILDQLAHHIKNYEFGDLLKEVTAMDLLNACACWNDPHQRIERATKLQERCGFAHILLGTLSSSSSSSSSSHSSSSSSSEQDEKGEKDAESQKQKKPKTKTV